MKKDEAVPLSLIQNGVFEILKYVRDVCDQNRLTYYLAYGTLIGAVRHQGFIPWDDDIDISMPVPDYLRFLEIAQDELGDGFFIQNYNTEDNCCLSYTKVRLKGTTVQPADWRLFHIFHGAWIDIFPMFYSDSDKDFRIKRFLYKFSTLLQAKDLYHNYVLVNGKNPNLILNDFLASVVAILPMKLRKRLHQKILDYVFSGKDGRYLCRCAVIARRFDADCFLGDICYHPFEQLSLRVPNNYDKVLRDEYGDYMQFPPEDKRGTHGEIEVII